MTTEQGQRDDWIAAKIAELEGAAAAWFAQSLGVPLAERMEECKRRIDVAPREAEKAWTRRQRHIPARVRREMLPADCAYCSDEADTIDHVIPVSQGGTSHRENLTPACSPCNWEKLDFTPEQWRQYREERGEPWPVPSRHAAQWERINALASP